MMKSFGSRKKKERTSKHEKQHHDTGIFFYIPAILPDIFLAGMKDIRNGGQRKYKRVDRKPFQNKMLCNKYADQKIEKCAVYVNGPAALILDPVLEQKDQKQV